MTQNVNHIGQRSGVAGLIENQCEVNSDYAVVSVDTVLNDAEAVDMRRYTRGQFTVPTGSTLTSLTFHTAHDAVDASFIPAYTEANAAVVMTVAATRRYPLPAAIAGAAYWKVVGNADGTLTNLVMKT